MHSPHDARAADGAKEVAFIRKAAAEMLGEMGRKVNAEVDERRQRLQRAEQRIAGLVHFIAEGDDSAYVRATLKDLEAQANTERRAIAELLQRGSATGASRAPKRLSRALSFETSVAREPNARP